MNKGNIDVHCHFFNFAFAFEELLEIGWRWLHGNYPYKSDELIKPKVKIAFPDELQGLVNYVASFFSTLVRSPEENYDYEQECYKSSQWKPKEPIVTVPLMMDIFFVFDKGGYLQHKTRLEALPATQRKAALTALPVSERDMPSFDAFAEEMKERVIRAYSEKVAGKASDGMVKAAANTAPVAAELERVIREFKADTAPSVTAKGLPSGGNVQMTRGYRKHLEALKALRKKNPGTVLPFLAVDPRRIGIEKLVQDQVIRGSFHGVKLYCPLGYLPSHPALYPVFQLCVKHNVPVTSHTSPGGFPSLCSRISTSSRKKNGTVVPVVFDKDAFRAEHEVKDGEAAQSLFFADPDKWLDVLESPGLGSLRVDFAHFGGQDNVKAYAAGSMDSNNWTGRIIRLMERFEHVYADISFCPDDGMLGAITSIMARHPVVQSRLMFGTDFVMIMMNKCGLQNYFNHYNGLKTAMVTTNPMAFLER